MRSRKMKTSCPLRVQAIRSRGQNPRLYVSLPLALAAAIGLEAGEEVQWELLDRQELHLLRPKSPALSSRARAKKQAADPIISPRFGAKPQNPPPFPTAKRLQRLTLSNDCTLGDRL